jgi:phage shock protein A
MSLFDKLATQVKGALHDTVDNHSDPGRTARQLIRDLEEQIAKSEDGLVDAKSSLKLLEGKRDAAKQDYDKYDGYARKAIERKDDNLAREALGERAKAEEKLKGYQSQVDSFKPTVDGLERQVTELRDKKDEMERKGEMLDAENKAAQAQDRVATAIAGVGDTHSIDQAFSEMERRTQKAQATAEAKAELAGLRKPLDDKFKDLDAPAPVDDALAALKKEMGQGQE